MFLIECIKSYFDTALRNYDHKWTIKKVTEIFLN